MEQQNATLQAEMDRVLQQCSQAINERNSYMEYARELESQNEDIRMRYQNLSDENQKLQTQVSLFDDREFARTHTSTPYRIKLFVISYSMLS